MPHRLVLVDDHPLYRIGLKAALIPHPDLEVVGEAADGATAYRVIEATRPDVVVLDLSLPGGDGITVTRKVLTEKLAGKVMILTMHKGIDYIRQAIAAGARGYAIKDEAPANVVDAIRAVATGTMYVSPELSHLSLQIDPRSGPGGTLERLSAREREVFSLIVNGHSSQRIARELSISIKTVETHRAHINQKLGVHSTGEIVRLAALRGMLAV